MRMTDWIATTVITTGFLTASLGSGSAQAAASEPSSVAPSCKTPPASFATGTRPHGRADWLGVLEAVQDSPLPEDQHQRVASLIVREADRNGLDPRLVAAVIQAESTFRIRATSHVGARGLMQVMPATGRWLLERRGERLDRASRLYDPELNVALGTAYLAELIERFGKVEYALIAYNAGPTAARRILRQDARRERFLAGYPRKVLNEFERLKRASEPLAQGTGGALANRDGTI